MEDIIQFDISKPLFEQVAQSLRISIAKAELKAGYKLPTLHELAQHYEVSQAVVAHALKVLEQEALIVSDKFQDYYVTLALPRIELLKSKLVEQYARDFVFYAQKYGLSLNEAQSILSREWDEIHELNT